MCDDVISRQAMLADLKERQQAEAGIAALSA